MSPLAAPPTRSSSTSPELVVASSNSSSPSPEQSQRQLRNTSSASMNSERVTLSDGEHQQDSLAKRQDTLKFHSSTNLPGSEAPSSSSSSVGPSGVVLDVACCDGPVKFQRVLNDNYSSSSRFPIASSIGPPVLPPENDESENEENGRPGCEDDSKAGFFKCEFCSHSFKSQYCYKKHARRHVLPAEKDEKKRQVRLLDLNVQYYPCKICGSKFPSYYFVHKHRKLYHANADDYQQRESSVEESSSKHSSSDKKQT